ncbi:hypothetical protein ANN_22539 [Periplaneta americana]|uniref:Reverse transcriptase domain-containing protein n=1 Tax=Periplaneta americana TaxID=6978 RepID=A0ABQ8S997_PERAM|nr:hypothetical protein ANN_22539 [Periplaneta americana]
MTSNENSSDFSEIITTAQVHSDIYDAAINPQLEKNAISSHIDEVHNSSGTRRKVGKISSAREAGIHEFKFKSVHSKMKGVLPRTSATRLYKKMGTTVPVKTHNVFQPLLEDPEIEIDNSISQQPTSQMDFSTTEEKSANSQNGSRKHKPPPPIVVTSKVDYFKLQQTLKNSLQILAEGKFSPVGLKLYCPKYQAYVNGVKTRNPTHKKQPDLSAQSFPPLPVTQQVIKGFRKCIAHRYFLDAWKLAYITAIPKQKKNPKVPANRRPISLINALGKVFERILMTRLLHSAPNLIPPYQAAYQQGLSTTHQLLRLVEQTTIGFNNRATTVAIFLDVKSAFDSVWHTGIIYKLIQSEVPDALFHIIADFLRNRRFCVKEDGCLSRQKKIQGGVPQGSVLGPYLYCAYTSDLTETDVTRLALYADDTLAYTTHCNADLTIGRLQRHVHLIEEWFQHWRLTVNTMKSQVIAFSRTRSVLQTKLTLYGIALEFQDSVKYLGIHLDSRLLWHTNIANTRAKTIARMVQLYPLLKTRALSTSKKVTIYKLLIRSVLLYGSTVWGYAPKTTLDPIRVVQNKVLRVIHNSGWYTRNEEIHQHLKVERLPNESSSEEILTELRSLNYPIESVRQLRRKAQDENTGLMTWLAMPIWVLTVNQLQDKPDIRQLRSLCHLRVEIEDYISRQGAIQCYKCQGFGHKTHSCHIQPRCVKCGENHESYSCQKPTSIPAKCANCQGDHPANYRQCPKYQAYVNGVKTRNPTHKKPPDLSAQSFPPLPVTQQVIKGFRKNIEWNSRVATTTDRILSKHADKYGYQILAPNKSTFYPQNANHKPDVLDGFLFRCNTVPLIIDTLQELSSDHNPVVLIIERETTERIFPQAFLSSMDWSSYRGYISQSISANPLIRTKEDIDAGIKTFENTLKAAKYASLEKESIQSYPHLNSNLRLLRMAKQRARKRWQKTRSQIDKDVYNIMKNRVYKIALEIKVSKFEKDVADAGQSNKIWTITKRLTKHDSYSKNQPLHGRDGPVYKSCEKAELIADCFENQFKPANECDSLVEHYRHVEETVSTFLLCPVSQYICLTSPSEVKTIIKRLKPKKAPGPDKINNMELKNLPRKALMCITKLFNQCIAHRYFPDAWKLAYITAIPKQKKNPKVPANRRPISLINALGKVFERILMTRLLHSAPNLIPPYQAAYQQGLSTTHQLLRLVEQTTIGFNNRATTVAIFLDVKSAFDSVWHTGIIYKLIQSEVPDALFHIIPDFLRNRRFCVKEDGCLSRQKKVQGGAPQGSVLGSYLYCAYTSDLTETDVTRLALYADDTLAYTTHRNADLAIGRLQRHVHLIEEWFQHWRLTVNTMKSQVIAFSRTRSVSQTKLTLYGTALEFQDSVKYLGIHLDSRLLWHTNIANTRARTIARMVQLYPLLKIRALSTSKKVTIYKLLIRSVLLYGSTVWGYAPKRTLDPIRVVQNKVLRVIHNSRWYTRNEEIHQDLKVENSGDEDCKYSDGAQLQAAAELVTELPDIVQTCNEEGGIDIRKDSDLISNEIDNSPPRALSTSKRERNKGEHHV